MITPSTSSSSPFSPTRTLTIRISSYKYPLEDVVYLWANSPPLVSPVEVSQWSLNLPNPYRIKVSSSLLEGPLQFEHAVAGDCVGNYTTGQISIAPSFSIYSSLPRSINIRFRILFVYRCCCHFQGFLLEFIRTILPSYHPPGTA